jgi:hypothetical protein
VYRVADDSATLLERFDYEITGVVAVGAMLVAVDGDCALHLFEDDRWTHVTDVDPTLARISNVVAVGDRRVTRQGNPSEGLFQGNPSEGLFLLATRTARRRIRSFAELARVRPTGHCPGHCPGYRTDSGTRPRDFASF